MATHADFLAPNLYPWQYFAGPDPENPLRAGLLTRKDIFPDFIAALVWVNTVAQLAEKQDHHPDIDIRYNQVILHVSSHDAGGLTDRDYKFALAANAVFSEK